MEETVVRRDLRHLTHPSPIQAYAIAIKLMREQIRRDGVHVMRVGGGHATARLRFSSQPCRSHKARQTLRARGEPRGTQFFVRARGDMRPPLRERDSHLDHDRVVDDRPPTLQSLAIRVVTGHGLCRHAAHAWHKDLDLVTSHPCPPQRDSFAKYTATFLRRPAPDAAPPARVGAAGSLAPASRPAALTPPHTLPAGLASTPAAVPVGPLIPGRSASTTRPPPVTLPPSAPSPP